jgi:hypothetical protein
MDFWNDDIKFVTQIEWKKWIQKACHNNVIWNKNHKINHHQIRNLKIKCIEIFPIYKIFFEKMKYHDFCHFLSFIIHFTLKY